MLEFRTSVISFNDETRGTVKSDRLETQAEMLIALDEAVSASRFSSIKSSALDVDRVFEKGERAQQIALQHSLERAYLPWRDGLEARALGRTKTGCPDRFRRGRRQGRSLALRGMTTFSSLFWNNEQAGSRSTLVVLRHSLTSSLPWLNFVLHTPRVGSRVQFRRCCPGIRFSWPRAASSLILLSLAAALENHACFQRSRCSDTGRRHIALRCKKGLPR